MYKLTRLLAFLIMASIMPSFAKSVWKVRYDGIGPVRIGMTLPELNTVLHEEFSLPDDKEDHGCFYVKSSTHPHVAFMIENDLLARIDVDTAGIATQKGIGVGDSDAHARQVYGTSLKVGPHQYTGPEGRYLTLRSGSGLYGMRFETYNGRIETFYAGSWKAIQYVEGCQ
jgi:hypothetical protein